MWSAIEKVKSKRRSARILKHVETCNVSEDMSDLIISSNNVLKWTKVKLNRENK